MRTLSPLAVVALVAGSVPIVAVSWRSLRHPGSHGFYRFFAFEAILALLVLHAGVWFDHPWAVRQLMSWGLLTGSVPLVVHGFRHLRAAGRPARAPTDPAILAFENTTALVTTGAYRFIRHPLYASLLLVAWGAALKRVDATSLALAAAATAFLVLTAKADERECVARFGDAYRDYMVRTRMFIPFLL